MKWIQRRGRNYALALILSLSMVLPMLSGLAVQEVQAAGYGLSNPRINGGVTTWDCVYFGNYWQEDTNGDGDAYNDDKTPIKWRVLSVDGDDALLLSDSILEGYNYNEERTSVTWETSSVRKMLSGEATARIGSYYFPNEAFSEAEQAAILTTEVANEDNPYYGTEGGEDTTDKLFLLSLQEIENPAYGFANASGNAELRRAKPTAYAEWVGVRTYEYWGGTGLWWLRSAGESSSVAADVGASGQISSAGGNPTETLGVRPALHLNLKETKLWSYAGTITAGETVASDTSGVQCKSALEIQTGERQSIGAMAYAGSTADLKTLCNAVKWTSDNPSVASVQSAGFYYDRLPKTENGYTLWWARGFVRVTGKKEGEATITGTCADGTTVSCKVTVTAATDDSEATVSGNAGSLTIGEDTGGSADSDDLEKVFPTSWNLKSTSFPVSMSQSVKADGSYTIKVSVGIGRSDILNDETTWNKYKKACESAKKANDKYESMAACRDAFGVKGAAAVSSSGWSGSKKPSLSVMGYVENTCDKNGNTISTKGAIAGDLSWKGSSDWTFATPIGPMYLKFEGEGKLSLQAGPKWDNVNKAMSLDGKMTITPSIALTGGYGIDKVASISATGKMEVPIQVLPSSKGSLKASASINMQVLFVLSESLTVTSYEKELWNTLDTTKTAITSSDLKLMSLDNVDSDAKWTGELDSNTASQCAVLQEKILTSSQPMLAEVDGKKVLVWQAYDDSQTTANSVVLNYSVLGTDGTWSEPKPIQDGEYGDSYADLQVVNGKLYLTWQKVTETISDPDEDEDADAMLDDMAAASEIYYAQFDSSTDAFGTAVQITNNNVCDMMPQFVENGEHVQIAYVRNKDNSLLQLEGENELWFYDVTEGTEEQLTSSPGTIDRYTCYNESGSVKALYVAQADNTVLVETSETEPVKALADLAKDADTGTITGLAYQDGTVSMISDGTLLSYDVTAKTIQKYTAGESSFDSNAVFCSNGDKSGVLWSTYDEDTQTGKLMASLKTEEGYSDPVELYATEGEVCRIAAPILSKDGTWSVAMNQENLSEETHSLCYLTKEASMESQVISAAVNEDEKQGALTGIDYVYQNTGDTAIDKIKIKITAEDGSQVEQIVEKHVEPGETVYDTAYVDLSGIPAGQKISVTISESQEEGTTENAVDTQYEAADIALIGTAEEKDGNALIHVTASNQSDRQAVCKLSLYADPSMVSTLGEAQEVTVDEHGSKVVDFTVPTSEIVYNENHAAYLTVNADVTGGDSDESNNTIYLAIYQGEKIYADTTTKEVTTPTDTQEKESPSTDSSAADGSAAGNSAAASANSASTQDGTAQDGTAQSTASETAATQKATAKETAAAKSTTLSRAKWISAKALRGAKLKLKYKKVKGAFGYQIQYAENKKFKKAKSKYTAKTSYTLTKQKRKTYYIRVRAYRVDGKKRVYGAWSKVKKVKVKK